MKNIGSWLRTVRLDKGLEIKDLAKKIGITGSQISRIETSKSDVTINSIVRIANGLNIELKDLLAALEIDATFPQFHGAKQRNKNSDIVTIQDVEGFLRLYRNQPRRAKDELIDAYHVVRKKNLNGLEGNLSEFDTAEIIRQATQALSNKFLPIPYPKKIDEEIIESIYISGGVITMRDLAAYVMASRRTIGQSLRKVAVKTEVSYNAIARLERGELERYLFAEIISLDQALFLDGKLTAISWAASEFQSGIARVKAMDNPISSLYKWDPEEFAFADTLITITRWNQVMKINQDWFPALRETLSNYK